MAVESTRWHFGYFCERATLSSQLDCWWNFGLDIGWGGEPYGVFIPFGSGSRLNPSFFDHDSVFAVKTPSDGHPPTEMRCWTLRNVERFTHEYSEL